MAYNNGNLVTLDADSILTSVLDDGGNPPTGSIWVTSTIISTISNGYKIELYTKNISSSNQLPLKYTFDLGLPTGSVPKSSGTYWVANPCFRAYPPGSGSQTSSRWAQQNMGYPGNTIYAPVLGLSSHRGDAIAFQTDYLYACEYLGLIQSGRYRVMMNTYYATGPTGPAPNDWFAPQEERTFHVWITAALEAQATGVLTGTMLSCLQPWITRMQELYPCRQNKKYGGRIYALYMAQADGPTGYKTPNDNPRRYWCYDIRSPGTIMGAGAFNDSYDVHPEFSDDWNSYLAGAVDPIYLKENGYVAIMLDASTGHTNSSKDLLPGNITKLPTGLRNSLPQLAEWGHRNGLDILFYAGYGGHKIQLDGAWDVDPTGLPNSGYYNYAYATSNFNSLVRPYISPDRWQRLQNEFDNGMFLYGNGVVCDAFPAIPSYTWAEDVARSWMDSYGEGKYLAQESVKPIINSLFFPTCYFPDTNYPGRCPLMEALIPGYQPVVFMHRSGPWDSDYEGYKDRVQQIESEGTICITIGQYGFVDRPFLGNKPQKDLGLKLDLRSK